MTRHSLFILPLLVGLAACTTPQQACINAATKDLHTIDLLIREAQGNIARGYGYTNVVKTIPQYVDCTPRPTDENPKPKPEMCLVDTAQTFRQPVAIDLDAEQTKLNQLLAKREELSRGSAAAIASCQAQYPEG